MGLSMLVIMCLKRTISWAALSALLIGSVLIFLSFRLEAAPEPKLVKDFNQISSIFFDGNQTLREVCSEIVELNGIAYFCGNGSQAQGAELWRSDGTEAGTFMVKDIIPGINGSTPFGLTVFDDQIIFAASTALAGTNSTSTARAIWKSDGTTDGTTLVYSDAEQGFNVISTVEIDNSVGRNRRVAFYQAGFEIIFFAQGNIWKTDGTAEGTVIIEEGHLFTNSRPVVIGASLFFVSVLQNQTALRRYDSSSGNISLIKLVPGNQNTLMTEHQGALFFVVDDSQFGRELWVSDGTEQGTALVNDFSAGAQDTQFTRLVSSGDFLFARLTYRDADGLNPIQSIWKTQGLPSNTSLLSTTFGNQMVDFNGLLVFECNLFNGSLRTCVSDESDTIRVIDDGDPIRALEETLVIGDKLYISRDFGELIVLNQASLTYLTVDINQTTAANGRSSPKRLANIGGLLFFAANDGVAGESLWKSDGTSSGTSLVKDINPLTNSGLAGSNLGNVLGDKLVFNVNVGQIGFPDFKEEIWITDGSEPGTEKLIDGRSTNDGFIGIGNSLVFSRAGLNPAPNTGSSEPYITDGTPDGTLLIKDIFPGTSSSATANFGKAGGIVYFSARTSFAGGEHLWKTDGTEAGTEFVKAINQQGGSDLIGSLTDVGGVAFFTANDGLTGTELWKSDGTSSGTVQVKDINPGSTPTFIPDNLVELNSKLLFIADGPNLGPQLWISDGSDVGTRILKQIGAVSCLCSNLTKIRDKVFFTANDGTDQALWVTDGTEAGTVKVNAVRPNSDNVVVDLRPTSFTASANHLYFMSNNSFWRSDGTDKGTVQIKDRFSLIGGNVGSGKGIGNTVYFSAVGSEAQTTTLGQELWRTDGTAEGTELVANIAPGFDGSFPRDFIVAEDRLYFSAEGVDIGRELFSLQMLPYVQRISYQQDDTQFVIQDQDEILHTFSELQIQFDQALNNPLGDLDSNDVTNPDNYLIVEAGLDRVFSTESCAAGVAGDDVVIQINEVEYNPIFFTSTISTNNGNVLGLGNYQLVLCSGGGLQNIFGSELDGNDDGDSGDDHLLRFRVDNPGVVNLAQASIVVNEDQSSGTIEVERSGGSLGQVSVAYSVQAATASQVDDFIITAATLTWDDFETGAKSIPFTLVDDDIDEGNEQFSVSLSEPTSGLLLGEILQSTVVITDDDNAGVDTTIRNGVSTISEAGDSQTVDISLTSEPLGLVQILASSSDVTEGVISPSILEFTPDNWNQAQVFNVSGVDDFLDDGDINLAIQFQVSASNDQKYDALFVSNLSFINIDNDEDSDLDGVVDQFDNCPLIANENQQDFDEDNIGDVCDSDDDNDTVDDGVDNCPLISNQGQANADGDNFGDVCDSDDDNDTVADTDDNCPLAANQDQLDTDTDGLGNVCDADDDNDSVLDAADNCPLVANLDQANNEGDDFGNLCDSDDDNDNVLDAVDNCPLLENQNQLDSDSDNSGDVCDSDDDNDTVLDGLDNCPFIENTDQANTDLDSRGDACDIDDDDDGVLDVDDAFPLDPAESSDFDDDGVGDNADLDDDADNVLDAIDNCLNLANQDQTDTDADTQGDACDSDDDNDGVTDILDLENLNPFVCEDSDNDGCDDCSVGTDQFGPLDDFTPNNDGIDTDNDGQCNVSDPDDDSDTILDDEDNCPLVENTDQLDENGFDDGVNEGDACEVIDSDFCFPIKAKNGSVMLVCL